MSPRGELAEIVPGVDGDGSVVLRDGLPETTMPAREIRGCSGAAPSVTQYGVQTPHSRTVLIVTTDRDQAEHALEWITDGRVVQRTITYGDWRSGNGDADIALAG